MAAASLGGLLVGVVLAPPDPVSQAVWWAGALALLAPASYLLVYRREYRRLPVVGSG